MREYAPLLSIASICSGVNGLGVPFGTLTVGRLRLGLSSRYPSSCRNVKNATSAFRFVLLDPGVIPGRPTNERRSAVVAHVTGCESVRCNEDRMLRRFRIVVSAKAFPLWNTSNASISDWGMPASCHRSWARRHALSECAPAGVLSTTTGRNSPTITTRYGPRKSASQAPTVQVPPWMSSVRSRQGPPPHSAFDDPEARRSRARTRALVAPAPPGPPQR